MKRLRAVLVLTLSLSAVASLALAADEGKLDDAKARQSYAVGQNMGKGIKSQGLEEPIPASSPRGSRTP